MRWRAPLVAIVIAGLSGMLCADEDGATDGKSKTKQKDPQDRGSEREEDRSNEPKAAEEKGDPSAEEGATTDRGDEKAAGEKQPTGDQPPENRPIAEPEDRSDRPSAEDVLRDLLQRREAEPIVAPSDRPEKGEGESGEGEASGPITVREEGQFIAQRRVHVVRARGDAPAKWLVTFQGDSQGLGDPPVFLMPCRLLEKIETQWEEEDRRNFIVSGRVFTYRGANYLLPTFAEPAPERGNLRP